MSVRLKRDRLLDALDDLDSDLVPVIKSAQEVRRALNSLYEGDRAQVSFDTHEVLKDIQGKVRMLLVREMQNKQLLGG